MIIVRCILKLYEMIEGRNEIKRIAYTQSMKILYANEYKAFMNKVNSNMNVNNKQRKIVSKLTTTC